MIDEKTRRIRFSTARSRTGGCMNRSREYAEVLLEKARGEKRRGDRKRRQEEKGQEPFPVPVTAMTNKGS